MTNSTNRINEFIKLLNNKLRLSDFIGQFISLTEKGNSHVGRCPFHNEKTPSFYVNNEKGLFHCFGCKVGGNIITFTSKYKNFTFKETVDYLSKYSGIKFDNLAPRNKYNYKNEMTLKILESVNIYFKKCLINSTVSKNYLKKRISEELMSIFDIGFCPDHSVLENYLKKEGFSEEVFKKLDLFIKNKKGEYFGRFSNRITFPIFDFENKIVGFGGRTISDSKIKYINSQDSEIFKKSKILFGFKQNIKFIRAQKEICLVEGYLDVIKMYQYDIKTSVSSLGTSLSEIQLRKMWSYTNTPYVCFDGDEAGKNASKNIAVKSLSYLIPGKSLKFIFLPDNLDPDQFIEKNGKNKFIELKSKALNLSEYIWNIILNEINEMTPEFVATIDEKILLYVSKIANKNVAKEYFRFLKTKKDKFIWGKDISSGKKINIFSKPEITENLNEKMLIAIIIFESKMLIKFFEEISNIKLQDLDLEEKKNKVIQLLSENDFKIQLESNNEGIFENSFFSQIKDLKETHLEKIEESDKETFFLNILNNIRLPNLIKEREIIKEELLSNKDKSLDNLLIKFQNLNIEIQNIQNKKID